MRIATGIGLVLLGLVALTGCGSTEKSEAGESPAIEQCVQRMLERAEGEPKRLVRDYLRRTYCEPFARKGWLHPDGTISIRAHVWLLGAGTCERVEGTTTMPCDSRTEQEAPVLECALLHFVRRNEVRTYLADLQRRRGKVSCDDDTPLAELGVAGPAT